MCGDCPKNWSLWLPLAEWWFNTHFHNSIGKTPYEVVYSQSPPLHLPYLPGECAVVAVDRSLQKREDMIATLKLNLTRAQNRMKQQADKRRSERQFVVGDWVWLKLQPYRQNSVQLRRNQKLAFKYYGPFQVIAAVGKVAYKIHLPTASKIHDVFHVSQLKSYEGPIPSTANVPVWFNEVDNAVQPKAVLEKRIVKVKNAAQVQYLVQWEGLNDYEATWEVAEAFVQKYPNFAVFT